MTPAATLIELLYEGGAIPKAARTTRTAVHSLDNVMERTDVREQ